MRKPLLITGVAALAALALAGCSSTADPSASTDATTEWPDSITISLVPSVEGEDLAEALDPLTTYLSENLGIEVKGVVASDYAATVEALGTDQAQVIITDAGSLYNATERYDAQLILRDVRFGATSYASVAFTNNPDKYCDDEPTLSTYAASGIELSYCNGIEAAGENATGQGPAALDALAKIDAGTKVALQAATSPAGYQYPVVAMREAGIDTDNDITQVPVEGNNNAVLAVYHGDAEVSFGYWDARTTVTDEAPDVAEKVVAFAYTDMIPNGGVAVSKSLPADLVAQLTELMDGYADSSDEAASVMFDLVGLSDWTSDTAPEEITRYGEILAQFAN
ncbi:MAG: ABC transporter substrate-binding protein [Microbacterium sp. SCN 70-200]|uniref:phosphate/phosphite/phosphonate ABC transporter substrate-binding protein n=1 Tax=unclassified Microbacterium TaxID=2609290 RepID=UPI00086DB270|nr:MULTISPECIES: phosphate/phosphite/phosphonate ABC transporter substrate-binding protein [unclassified Microbacterium]MBN9215594.1 phosphate/phosphite/phosphonate ABC transporter substrate-binding protein [Microbacterium sp.]ODT41216.1 MAG: ABC transporter substrate-binding protein [Microbacterium sp. SCN 70-200]OJV79388.1 MAG: ABC transporter substrate-binding protein [Microbacterium sp. 70-16]